MAANYRGERRGRRGQAPGFTLVELLVVIGIIAVLISILLPTINKAREAANKVKCASNEKQIVAAMFQYAQMYEGWLPPAYWKDGTKQTPKPWKSWDACLIDTVMKVNRTGTGSYATSGVAVFACPSDDLPRSSDNATYGDGKVSFSLQSLPIRSYAINQTKWCYGEKDAITGKPDGSYVMPWSGGCPANVDIQTWYSNVTQMKLSQVPSRIWLLGENWGTTSYFTMAAVPDVLPGNNYAWVGIVYNSTMQGSPARFHARNAFGIAYQGAGWRTAPVMEQSGGNYGYADGHVEFVKYSEVIKVRADTDPFTNGTYMEDHWKWKPSVK